ncbi:MAG: amidohydrolase family protein [Firmicutes bacterium]|jgi:predicted TIM-barrel fold metal-dependent hydrolase|nr:amidohydrolase family protein [Bacillota bacterium]
MIIDFHAHVGRSWMGWEENTIGPEEMLRIYDACGIEKACISSWNLSYDPIAGNDEVAEIVRRYPDRFMGFGVISPRWSPQAADEVDRCINDLGMKGIKMHPSLNSWPGDSPIVYPVMERIEKYGVPVLFHTWNDDFSHPQRIGNLARKFPKVKVVMGHMGFEAFYDAAFLAEELPNVYLDTTGFYNEVRTLREVVRIAGAEKVVFGTDGPALNIPVELAKIVQGDISEQAKEMILGPNAAKLLGLK